MRPPIESNNPVVRSIIEGAAPRPAQLAAARGMLPLPQNDLLEILVNFAASDDPEIAQFARQTLTEQDESLLTQTLKATDVPRSVLGYFSGKLNCSRSVHEAVILNPLTPPESMVAFARNTQDSELLELIAMNQQLLIRMPSLIDAIISNPQSTSEAHRRASETKREFFEKERGAQQVADELRAQGKEAAAEFIESSQFASDDKNLDDALLIASMIEVPDNETDDSWMGLEFLEELYEESDEQRQRIVDKIIGEMKVDDNDMPLERVSVINRIMRMGMKDRVKLAIKGDREARGILIRDPNRVVSQAVINNPRITEQEVEKIASMRSVPEDILRQLANNRQWARSYSIVHNLARNPRTPIGNVMTIMTRLQAKDLKALSANKNVSDAVRRNALRLSNARKGS